MIPVLSVLLKEGKEIRELNMFSARDKIVEEEFIHPPV